MPYGQGDQQTLVFWVTQWYTNLTHSCWCCACCVPGVPFPFKPRLHHSLKRTQAHIESKEITRLHVFKEFSDAENDPKQCQPQSRTSCREFPVSCSLFSGLVRKEAWRYLTPFFTAQFQMLWSLWVLWKPQMFTKRRCRYLILRAGAYCMHNWCLKGLCKKASCRKIWVYRHWTRYHQGPRGPRRLSSGKERKKVSLMKTTKTSQTERL